ncbi:uncharacterized protein LOC119080737 [Bradysia coprophila]|uniref:uncharacterized protein LOC119080737 n=1 Tax=Bradysia coprophila TaxID=38358 RepID=UPI00187DA8AA|nr:uncharacterized protein LOC119080737 [Bradysia coprophila]
MENKLDLKMMSPEEVLNQKLTESGEMFTYGTKKCFPDETTDEVVNRLQDDLLKVLCYERVEKSNSRSQAKYNAMTGLIVVTRKLGKWNTYGYRLNNLDCLRYCEALYLIDTNRLELYYDSVLVSLEQAYVLLLNNQHDDKSHEKYIIFSNLTKAGYIVQPHRGHIQESVGSSCWSREITPADKCVWRCLLQNVEQPSSREDMDQEYDDQLYLKIQQNMKTIEEAIKCQQSHSFVDLSSNNEADSWQNAITTVKGRNASKRKRKLQATTSKKKTNLGHTTNHFLDVLTHERDVCNFRNIFDEIQVIQLDQTHCDNNVDTTIESDVEFDFDLYLARPNFKQSDPGVPNFRILIFKSNEKPPTRNLIVKAFLKPTVRAPVLVFYINELMRVSAFLYRISL